MVVSGVLCLTLILIGLSQIEAHELYLPSKKIGLKFRKVEVPGIQECIEACNLDRKCESLAMNGHAQCFIEDPTGNVTLRSIPDAVIMVKNSVNKCREDCPADFITLGLAGGCYYPVLDQKLYWEDAEAACQELDGEAHLISINNLEEALAVRMYLEEKEVNSVWTGGQDPDDNGVFTWIGSQEEVNEDRWYPDQPEVGNNQLCVYFRRFFGLLFDNDCLIQENYICEIQTKTKEELIDHRRSLFDWFNILVVPLSSNVNG